MTPNDIKLIYDDALKIEGFDIGSARDMTFEEICEAYNGTGPERWPANVRDKIDSMAKLYAPAVLVHDCDFTLSDGSEDGLEAATERFRKNTDAILDYYYPRWTWQQLKASYRHERGVAVTVKAALDIGVSMRFCRQAWLEAYDKKQEKEG